MFSGVMPKSVRAFAALVAPVPPRVIGSVPDVILAALWLWLAEAAPMLDGVAQSIIFSTRRCTPDKSKNLAMATTYENIASISVVVIATKSVLLQYPDRSTAVVPICSQALFIQMYSLYTF